MTIEKLKSEIQFVERNTYFGRKVITAKLEVAAEQMYDPEAFDDATELLKNIKEDLKYMILKMLYEDQRKELYNAIMDIMNASQMDYASIDKARERIMNAARFQKPTV